MQTATGRPLQPATPGTGLQQQANSPASSICPRVLSTAAVGQPFPTSPLHSALSLPRTSLSGLELAPFNPPIYAPSAFCCLQLNALFAPSGTRWNRKPGRYLVPRSRKAPGRRPCHYLRRPRASLVHTPSHICASIRPFAPLTVGHKPPSPVLVRAPTECIIRSVTYVCAPSQLGRSIPAFSPLLPLLRPPFPRCAV